MTDEKKIFRKKVKEICSSFSEKYIKNAGESIQRQVIDSPDFKKSSTVFVYINTDSEPDTKEIIKKAWENGKTVCVPRCISDCEMCAVELKDFSQLEKGKFGISEPEASCGIINKNNIDLGIIPCVAAAESGERLGHGAGYYDRFLEGTDFLKYCLCFEGLVFDYVPCDTYDIIMDYIVSENKIY